MNDRTVHAEGPRFEIVRYDRAGKWFIEYERAAMVPCRHVGVGEAAYEASRLVIEGGGEVFFGKAGGKVFDARVQRLLVGAVL